MDLIQNNTAWLFTKIYENPVFYFDYWSIVHFYIGIALFVLLTFLKIKNRWILLSIIFLVYETIEIIMILGTINVFEPETIKDQFTDILIGCLGGFVGQYLLKNKIIFDKQVFIRYIITIFAASSIAFVWVGSYGYQYEQSLLNSPGLNWLAFLLWFTGLFLLINTYSSSFKKLFTNTLCRIATSWFCFFTALLILEYVGYYVLLIHHVRHAGSPALIFGLIHGPKVLHTFYLSAPLIGITVFEIFNKIFFDAQRNEILIQKDLDSSFFEAVRFQFPLRTSVKSTVYQFSVRFFFFLIFTIVPILCVEVGFLFWQG